MSSVFFASCDKFSAVGVITLLMSLTSILLNSLPLYTILSWDWSGSKLEPNSGILKLMKQFITALLFIDFCSMMILVPSYLLLEFMNHHCLSSILLSIGAYQNICGVWALMFFGFKLFALFLVTFGGYATYMHVANKNSEQAQKKSSSLRWLSFGLRLNEAIKPVSNSKEEITKDSVTGLWERSGLLLALMLGAFALSFFVGALPLLAVGPLNVRTSNTTSNYVMATSSHYVCNLRSFSRPRSEKEYSFLFSLLMSSFACLLVIAYSFVQMLRLNTADSACKNLFKATSLQGCLFLVSWLPVMITVAAIMSGHQVGTIADSLVVLWSFSTSLVNPVLYLSYLDVTRVGLGRLCCLRGRRTSQEEVRECAV